MSTKLKFPRLIQENNATVIFEQREDEDKCMVGHDEDYLPTPFQCDWCWFQSINERNPDLHSHSNSHLLRCIRRVNLDICWSRTRSTVEATLAGLQKGIRMSNDLGVPSPYPPRGPLPIEYDVDFSVALQIIQASLEPGYYLLSSQTFDTVRCLQIALDNVHMSSANAQY
eukprot:5653569-Ditylum_brightwellii.AAC.1